MTAAARRALEARIAAWILSGRPSTDRDLVAAEEFRARRDRRAHPDGRPDTGGRWYPAAGERCGCCEGLRAPSRAYPWSLAHHCRTAAHVGELYGVPAADVRRLARVLDAWVARPAPAAAEGGAP